MPRSFTLLLLGLLACIGQPTVGSTCWSEHMHVRIVNKTKLCPERLADALYAKSIFAGSSGEHRRLLREAARLAPSDPVHVFRLLPTLADPFRADGPDCVSLALGGAGGLTAADRRELLRERAILERTLAIDPGYLPALYKYALTKPTPEQRIETLEAIAHIDPENAKPYYIIALLRYDAINRDRKPIAESETQAHSMTPQEWASVLEALKRGNACPVFRATYVRVPSARDVMVSTGRRRWSDAEVESFLALMLNELGIGGLDETPRSFTGFATMRQIARQAVWEVTQLNKQGKRQEAEGMLQVIYGFSEKLAASEPHRAIPLMVAAAVRRLARSEDARIAKASDDQARLVKLWGDAARWQGANKDLSGLYERWYARLESSGFREIPDSLATEEAEVTAILKKLGLLDKAGGDR